MVREESNKAGDIFLEYLLLALASLRVSLGLDTQVPSRSMLLQGSHKIAAWASYLTPI